MSCDDFEDVILLYFCFAYLFIAVVVRHLLYPAWEKVAV